MQQSGKPSKNEHKINKVQKKEVTMRIRWTVVTEYDLTNFQEKDIKFEDWILYLDNVPTPQANLHWKMQIEILNENKERIKLNTPEFKNAIWILADELQQDVLNSANKNQSLITKSQESLSEWIFSIATLFWNYIWLKEVKVNIEQNNTNNNNDQSIQLDRYCPILEMPNKK